MTRIDFYTGVDDKLKTACRLSAKAVSQGLRVMIFTPDRTTSGAIGDMLWRQPATGFLPHCEADNELAPETPVIVDHRGDNLHHDEVLVNLTGEWPPFFSRFSRLVEIVSREEEDRNSARERFRFYKERGYEIHHHDLGSGA